jgi:cholesterol transport system auxiliary component
VVLGLRSLAVDSPSWLDSAALQYRLAYADTARRQSYTQSRWVAPPGELVEQALRRSVIPTEGEPVAGGCKLRLDMDEFVHLFDAPDASRGVIEVRATLFAPRMDALLARRSFSLSKPAPSNDARGGVVALSGAVEELAGALNDWLGGLGGEGDRRSSVIERCGGA